MQEKEAKGRAKAEKKAQYWHHKQHVSLLTLQSGTHIYTHIVTPPHQPLQFAAKKAKGEVFHTHTTN